MDTIGLRPPPRRGARRATTGVGAAAALMAIAHGVNDGYMSFLAPLLPRIMEKLGLSVALAAVLAMTLSIASSLVQPAAGYLADHVGRKPFVVLGPLVTAVFLSLIGWAPTFGALMMVLAVGGLGSAAFHPPGASMAVKVQDGRGSGLRFSVFSFGGAAGYAVGPLAAVAIVAALGLEGMWVAMIPGIVLAIVLWWLLPSDAPNPRTHRPPPGPALLLRRLRGPLGLLFGISAIGAFVQRVYLTMSPIIVSEHGGSEAMGAVGLTVYLGAQAIGTLTGGFLTDRWDRRHLLAGVTFLSLPTHLAAVLLEPGSAWALTAAATSGFLNMAMLPPLVVMAQELIPEGAAVSSGIVMGLAWAAGSVAMLGTGVLADQIGVVPAAAVSMPAILFATMLALHPSLRVVQRPAN